MGKLFFAILILLPPVSRAGAVGDFFLAIPPAAKLSISVAAWVDAAGNTSSGEVNPGNLLLATSGLILVGGPNALLLGNLLSHEPDQVTFWRKFVLYEEAIMAGSMLTATVVAFMNSNEDIYPDGRPVQKKERFLFTEREILAIQLEMAGVLGLSALIDLIPFAAENRPGLAVHLPREPHSKSDPGTGGFGLALVWPI